MHAVNWDIFEIKDSGSKEDTMQQKKRDGVFVLVGLILTCPCAIDLCWQRK